MKSFVLVFVLVVFSIIGVTFYIYENMGVGQYVVKMQEIGNLDNKYREKAKKEFVCQDDKYNGVVMRVSENGYGGVWVWGCRGPKYYEADEYTVFSYYSMCKNLDLLDQLKNKKTINTRRKITQNVIEWGEMVEVGDYIVIMKTRKGYGGTVGKLREAIVYDWWPMLPINVGELCIN